MYQPPPEANSLPNAGAGNILLSHHNVVTLLICHPRRQPPLPIPVDAESSIGAECISFHRRVRAYFLNVFGNGGGRRQEDGRELESRR